MAVSEGQIPSALKRCYAVCAGAGNPGAGGPRAPRPGGDEANRDAEFGVIAVRRFKVPFALRRVDAWSSRGQRSCPEEEAGRLLRYRVFEECRGWSAGA